MKEAFSDIELLYLNYNLIIYMILYVQKCAGALFSRKLSDPQVPAST